MQVLPGIPWAVVFSENVECFFDAVSPDGFQIVCEQVVETSSLSHGEIFGAFEEAIARLAQHRIASLRVKSFGFLAAGLVDGFIEFFHNMKSVENVQRCGQHSLDDCQIGFPHVGADDGDRGTALGTKILKPTGQGTFFTVFDDANEASGSVVDLVDQRAGHPHVIIDGTCAMAILADGSSVLTWNDL